MKLVTAVSNILRASIALLFCIATAASGQEKKPAFIPPNASPFPTTVELMEGIASDQMPDPDQGLLSVDVSVTDGAGKPVAGLTEKDFALLDNDQQQKIVSFQAFDGAIAQPASSLEIVLVIDELDMGSGSEHKVTILSNTRREVENFLRANGGVLEKPTIIYRITRDGLFVTPDASMDGNALAQEIEQPALQRQIWSPSAIRRDLDTTVKFVGLRPSHQVEAVWRDITQSLIALGSIAIEERRSPGRKLMFWLGNGWQIIENPKATGFSDLSIELATRMREARIDLWSASEMYDAPGNAVPIADIDRQLVEGSKTDSTDLRYLSLPVIATRSGGGMLKPGDDLAARISERVREERSYYCLTFDPPRTDRVDQYHHLKIEIDKPDLRARVFEDYFDEPVFYDQEPETQSVSVKQLQALIASAQGISDAKLAHQFENIGLTERLSSAKAAVLEKSVHGKKAREALQVVADKSEFFAPPDEEIIAALQPEKGAQQQIVSKVISYINSTIPHLPDFLATRTSVQYYARPANEDQTWKTAPADQSLHEGEIDRASIRFSKGKELVKDESVKKMPDMQGEQLKTLPGLGPIFAASLKKTPDTQGGQSLKTVGVFGPILSTVTVALTWTRSQLNWDHWEKGDNGRLAVFRYHVTQGTPFFSAGFCCLPVDNRSVPFIQNVPFHGVIAVDSETGAIMRLTLQSDLGWRLPLERSDLMIEYGPVQGGSRLFICPSKSVSISRQRRIMTIHEWGETFKVYAPFETVLNEMRFDNYHVFGSTSRILPDFVEPPKGK